MKQSKPALPGTLSTPGVKKVPKLTYKQAKFVKAKAEGKTGTEAAVIAYGVDEKTASVMASQNLGKLSIQEAVEKEMAKQGLTIEAIITPVREALTAEKVSIVGNGDEAMAEITPDHTTRLSAVKIAAQFMGVGKGEVGQSPSVHFHNHTENKGSGYGF